MRRRVRRLLRCAAIALLSALLSAPELALASKPLDAMSDAELDRYVQQLNESANWRKYRRPGDPPDFVPGKPVRVTVGAGASFGRGGGGGNQRSFRRSGLSQRRSGLGGRRRGGDEQTAMDRGRGTSRSSFGSSTGASPRGGSSRGGFGSNNSFGSGGFGQ